MKKVLLLLLLVPFLFITSCEEDPDKYCWEFTVTTEITTSQPVEGYPKKTEAIVERCDYTESEAKIIAEKLSDEKTEKIDGITYTTKITATYKIKS